MKKLNMTLLFLGLAFLAYLLWKVGPRELWQPVKALGWGVIPLIFSEGVANFAHTLGWRHCIKSTGQPMRLRRLFRIAMAGFAINYLTPSASMGGEVTKASLLAVSHDGPEAVSSVLMDKLCMAFAHLFVAVLGSVYLLWQVRLPVRLWIAMAVSSGLLTVGIVTFLLMQKHGRLSGFLRWLADHKLGGRAMEKAALQVAEVDQALKIFYLERPLDLLLSVGWHLVGHAVAILQVWLFLRLLHQPAPLVSVLAAAFLGLWIDLLTFAVPLNLGALEGGRIVALKAAGCGPALGMAFGLAIRIAQVFWAVFGLVNYGILATQLPAAAPGKARFPASATWQRITGRFIATK
jgi:glycosyltransferase 2 family protein